MIYPNKNINTGVLSGLHIGNTFGPLEKECLQVLSLPYENVSVWTYKKGTYSKLISEINPAVNQLYYWKNFGILFKYARAFTSAFESFIELDYNWIKNFDRFKKIEELHYPKLAKYMNDNFIFDYHLTNIYDRGEVLNLSYFFDNKKLFKELYVNDTFFFSVQHLVSAFSIFRNYHMHLSIPTSLTKRYNQIYDKSYEAFALPRLEIAIIEATKAIEGLLNKSSSKEKITERWVKLFNIDPNKKFLDTELSYVNYYANLLNEIKNNITQYIKSKAFDRLHVMAIQAQEFARKLIVSYYEKLISSSNKEDKTITFGEEVELRIKSRKI